MSEPTVAVPVEQLRDVYDEIVDVHTVLASMKEHLETLQQYGISITLGWASDRLAVMFGQFEYLVHDAPRCMVSPKDLKDCREREGGTGHE